jgi:RNA polymerase sigma factor (TIGR02999 family)
VTTKHVSSQLASVNACSPGAAVGNRCRCFAWLRLWDLGMSELRIHGDVTPIPEALGPGERNAASDLLPLLYNELRRLVAQKLCREVPGQTLQATALVHEAYLRLVDTTKVQLWESRWHFFAAAAESMRRILVDNARRRGRLKRGGELNRVDLDKIELTVSEPPDELIALDEALTMLAKEQPHKAQLVNLRYFGGLTHEEAAQAMGISTSTADRHWAYARAWLYRHMASEENQTHK